MLLLSSCWVRYSLCICQWLFTCRKIQHTVVFTIEILVLIASKGSKAVPMPAAKLTTHACALQLLLLLLRCKSKGVQVLTLWPFMTFIMLPHHRGHYSGVYLAYHWQFICINVCLWSILCHHVILFSCQFTAKVYYNKLWCVPHCSVLFCSICLLFGGHLLQCSQYSVTDRIWNNHAVQLGRFHILGT